MTKGEENRFDSMFRSVLRDAQEDVPDGIWARIEERLPAVGTAAGEKDGAGHEKTRRIIPLWARISYGIAAAAAIASILFVSGTFDDSISRKAYDSMADAGIHNEVDILDEDTAAEAVSPGKTLAMAELGIGKESIPQETLPYPGASSSNGLAYTGVDTAQNETEIINTDDGSHTDIAGGTGTKDIAGGAEEIKNEHSSLPDTDADDALNSAYDDSEAWKKLMEEEKQNRKIRTSITLSGNAVSNTNAAASRDASAPVSYLPSKNTPKKDVVSEASESSYSVPVTFGVGVKINFTERWALGAGVNYSHLSRTFAGTFFDYEGDVLVSDNTYSNIRNRQDYIGIPVNVYFSILRNDFIDFYAYAGGTAEKCVSNKFIMTAEGMGIHHSEPVQGFQFSANAGLGMEFIIADTFGIYIDPSMRYYFPDARQPRSIRTAQPLMFGLELGFRIRL